MGIGVQPNCCVGWQVLTVRTKLNPSNPSQTIFDYPSVWDINRFTGKISKRRRILHPGGVPLLPAGLRKHPGTGKWYLWENNGGQTAARLFEFRIKDGQATLIGALGSDLAMVEGDLAFHPDNPHACYGMYVLQTSPSERRKLVTIDLTTGDATVVGDLLASATVVDWNALDFHPTTKVLWMLGAIGSPQVYHVYTVNITTGAATDVATVTPAIENANVSGAAFDSDGTLYFATGGPANPPKPFELWKFADPATGVAEFVGTITPGLEASGTTPFPGDYVGGLAAN